MKIGVSIGYKKLDAFEKSFGEYNVQHIQIGGIPGNIEGIRKELSEKIKALKSQNPNIEISLHAYNKLNLAEEVDEVRMLWIELAKKNIYLARDIGAKFVNFHAGYGVDAGRRVQHEKCINNLIPVFKELVEVGSECNVEIHIENVYPEQRNSDFCKLGDRVSDFKKIFDIKSEFLKLCYDYGHGNLDEQGIDILRSFNNRLGSIHAHDNDQLADIHWPIGQEVGTIDWENEIQYLKNIKFDGVFILESYIDDQVKSLEFLHRKGF
ncbi:sugar phosphate isomerase/epimerase family protein [Oceanirhabdus sp. W0125-5]|uniref:sugar phosphate isomerase/epimerase family protein n=1 Tax=Oceanirhabdus sp. W0125-5 TaxID=2999116 RepID=UPI0022F33E6A|nr:sugar phosphate isomerase/epimerase family protein [Oceanirhabdus sp. W0125-5]WBW95575.1 sugar phosphate isomerase/epimerase [Oceanirhabdus sp. W0125-5]